MPSATLLNLPVEVLQLIGGYLDSGGLSGFSKSSKTCRSAAGSLLFSNITLCFVSVEKLEQDLDQWTQILESNAAWKAVQRFNIHAELDTPPLLRMPDLGDDPLGPWKYYADDTPPAWTCEHDGDFARLAAFLDRLPALADVVWACSNQLPPCVLSVLEEKHRTHQLRLHLRTFRLRSLLVPPGARIEVDPYDKRLARSPVLYSLASRYAGYDTEGNSDFNLEAIMAMTASLTPNLKELFLCRELPGSSPYLLAAWKVPRQTWQGDELGEVEQSKHGSLTSLVLTGTSQDDDLRVWYEKTDFTKLRALKLYQNVAPDVLDWLTAIRPFSNDLKEVAMNIRPNKSSTASEALERFLDSLPLLQRLRLSRLNKQSVLDVALRRHGRSLQGLLLGWTAQDIKTLSSILDECPNLQELALPITRMAGREEEVACYRAIGELQHLRHLTLTLQVCKRSNSSDEESMMRTALIDSAVDESLAAAIFKTISASSTSQRATIQSLKSSVKVDQKSLGRDIEEVCMILARSWICEKNQRDDAARHSCIVRELGVEDREEYEGAFGQGLDPGVEAVVRDLWPDCATGDWRHDWHSWPLQETGETL